MAQSVFSVTNPGILLTWGTAKDVASCGYRSVVIVVFRFSVWSIISTHALGGAG